MEFVTIGRDFEVQLDDLYGMELIRVYNLSFIAVWEFNFNSCLRDVSVSLVNRSVEYTAAPPIL